MSDDVMKRKIKEAFKSKSKNKSLPQFKSKYDYEQYPTIYELDTFLHKSGYRLVDLLYDENRGPIEFVIETIKESYLNPPIHHDIAENQFLVEVRRYGNLVASDLEEIMKGYQTALEVLQHLESMNQDVVRKELSSEK